MFFVIIITVQICKFNITVSTQFLLLYYSLWCPGLQGLQRFDLIQQCNQKMWKKQKTVQTQIWLHFSGRGIVFLYRPICPNTRAPGKRCIESYFTTKAYVVTSH